MRGVCAVVIFFYLIEGAVICRGAVETAVKREVDDLPIVLVAVGFLHFLYSEFIDVRGNVASYELIENRRNIRSGVVEMLREAFGRDRLSVVLLDISENVDNQTAALIFGNGHGRVNFGKLVKQSVYERGFFHKRNVAAVFLLASHIVEDRSENFSVFRAVGKNGREKLVRVIFTEKLHKVHRKNHRTDAVVSHAGIAVGLPARNGIHIVRTQHGVRSVKEKVHISVEDVHELYARMKMRVDARSVVTKNVERIFRIRLNFVKHKCFLSLPCEKL